MSASWQQKYEDLQREFESFKQHSSDFERELETELTASQKENEKLKDKVSRLEHTLAQAQQRMDGELNRARSECAALQRQRDELKAENEKLRVRQRDLEHQKDDADMKLRIASAQAEDAQHRLEMALEEKVLLQEELEETRATESEGRNKLEAELRDVTEELMILKRSATQRTLQASAAEREKKEREDHSLDKDMAANGGGGGGAGGAGADGATGSHRRGASMQLQLQLQSRKGSRAAVPSIKDIRWFMVDAQWLNTWRAYQCGGGPRPGAIDNAKLLQDGRPRKGLRSGIDYHPVQARTWAALVRLYGGGPPIARAHNDMYTTD